MVLVADRVLEVGRVKVHFSAVGKKGVSSIRGIDCDKTIEFRISLNCFLHSHSKWEKNAASFLRNFKLISAYFRKKAANHDFNKRNRKELLGVNPH